MASNFYRAKDAPQFKLGHRLELIFIGAGLVASLALLVDYGAANKKHEKRTGNGGLGSCMPEELLAQGDRAITFRYVY